MILRRIFPEPGEPIKLDSEDVRDRLSELYGPGKDETVRLNLVTTIDGSVAGSDGTSESLTNRADRKLLGVIRRLSDVVLVGANSVRVEGYQIPRTAPLAIVTGSGDLSGHRMPHDLEAGRLLVLCPASAIDRARQTLGTVAAEYITIEDDNGRLRSNAIIASLHAHGLKQIVCEGGPILAAQLLDAGLVDEICLTTSPHIGGHQLPLLVSTDVRQLTLKQLMVDDRSGLYARWIVQPWTRA